jgi:hypothetical protein
MLVGSGVAYEPRKCDESEEVCSQKLAVIKIRNAAKNVPVLA